MSRLLSVLAPLVAVLVLPACVPISAHPLSDPAGARFDQRLAGGWRVLGSHATWAHVYFSRRVAGRGTMGIFVIEPRKDGTLAMDSYEGFVTHLPGADFLNVRYTVDGGVRSGYVLVRFSLERAERLEISLLDEKRLKAAVASGRIYGAIEVRGPHTEVTLTADSKTLGSFLASREGAALFQPPQVLERLP